MAEFVFDAEALTSTLEAAGYDVESPAPGSGGGVGVVSARREGAGSGVAVAVIDRGGRLRFTLTRAVAPERVRDVSIAGQRCRLVDTSTRTTVALLTLSADTDLAALLAELECAAAR
jgi:hypothetical protein